MIQKPRYRLLFILFLLLVAYLTYGFGVTIAPPAEYHVGDSAIYPYAIRYRELPNQLYALYFIGVAAAVIGGAFWLWRGRSWRLYLIAALLLSISCAGIGWWAATGSGRWDHVDSIEYEGASYQLAAWYGPTGGWHVWECASSGWRCHVIQAVNDHRQRRWLEC